MKLANTLTQTRNFAEPIAYMVKHSTGKLTNADTAQFMHSLTGTHTHAETVHLVVLIATKCIMDMWHVQPVTQLLTMIPNK